MTKAMWTGFVAGACAMLACGLPARAEEERTAQPYVIVVGVGNYADKDIKQRAHAEDDAKALYDLFTDKDYLGVDAKHVRLLLGIEDAKRNSQPATKENLLKAFQWVAKEARTNDPVYIAYIGEGGPLGDLGDRHCYFASDSSFKDRDKDAVSNAEVGEALKGLKTQRLCVFLDVNFKGYNPPPGLAIPEPDFSKQQFQEFRGDHDNEDQDRIPGRIVFLATRPTSVSLDGPDHGIFTEALLEGLKGAADKDGYEPDGLVTVDELAKFMDDKVHDLARKYAKTDKEKEQFSIPLGSPNSHFVLTTNPAAHPKAVERLDKFEQLVKDGKVAAKLADEGKQMLSRMPKLDAQKALRKAYQALVDGKTTPDKFEAERDGIVEGMKLERSTAQKFARKVIEVTKVLQADDGYYKEVNQAELVNQAVRKLYHYLEEKVPEDVETRLKKVKDLDEDQLKDLLIDARLALGKREDLKDDKDINVALVEMLRTLDPYTTYIDPQTQADFEKQMGRFTGIGIQVRKDAGTDFLLVVTPLKDTPAYRAGLQTGDLITKITREVDDESKPLPGGPETTDTKGLLLSDAVKKILGPKGTKVKLTVQREGEDKPLEFEITRGPIEVESVFGVKRKTNDEWDFMLDKDKKIGYIRLTQFQDNSFNDIAAAMADLKKQGVKAVILDLRFNPGGLLTSAVDISDLFIDDGLIVSIRPRVGPETKFEGKHEGSLLGFPMVCMVNGMSASGSEIVSACLQDHHRAWIIGERSYGKGSVQNIRRFGDGRLKLTTNTFWRPSGKNLNKRSTSGKEEDVWGVTPDKVVKLTDKDRADLEEHMRNNESIPAKNAKPPKEPKAEFKDVQLQEAIDYLTEQIKTAANNPIKKAG